MNLEFYDYNFKMIDELKILTNYFLKLREEEQCGENL